MQNNTGNLTAVVPVLKDVIRAETGKTSVISSPEATKDGVKISDKVTVTNSGPAKEPEIVFIGKGEAAPGFVFTRQPEAFVPQWVGRGTSVGRELPAPQAPRRSSCTTTFLQGVTGENVQNLLVWAAPLVDSSGRWLDNESMDFSTGTMEYSDSLLYYLVQREDLNTGEVSTVGMVAHSRQIIHPLRTFLAAEHAAGRPGATTDIYTRRATFHPSLYQNVLGTDGDPILDEHGNNVTELVMPPGHEEYFQFLDTTAIFGHSYKYVITAITNDQKEGASRTVVPGAPQAAGGTEVAFAPAWCSTYPMVDAGANGQESYLDLTLQIGSLITDVEVSLIPIQDDVLEIDTSAPGESEPAIIETNPIEVLLYVSSVPTTQVIEFVGRNIEACGGIASLTLGTGITLKTNGITKTQIGTSNDWKYQIQVDVAPTAVLGIKTMVITCLNGKTALCSQFKAITGTGAGTEGPTFEVPNQAYRFKIGDTLRFVIKGKLMASITGFTAEPNKTTVSIVSISANHVEVSCTNFTGAVTLVPTLMGGMVRTMKDTVRVSVTPNKGGDPHDPSDYPDTDTSREIPTLRAL